MGGYVTFALFRRAPERFSGFVLADTRASADTPEGRQAAERCRPCVNKDGAAGVADQMVPKLLGETTRRERPAVEREVRRLISQNSVAAIDGASMR